MVVTAKSVQQRRQSAKPVEFKALAVDPSGNLTVAQDTRTISGYAAIFNNIDDAGDMIMKGAFAKSIQERGPNSTTNRKIIALWQHDMDEPIGKITVLQEDDFGLYFEAILDKVPRGDQALEQLASGTLNQFSIGYNYLWDKMEYDSVLNCFVCKEINLFEISVVSLGCNELTGFMGMKASQLESEHNQLNRDIEVALKTISDPAAQYNMRKLFAKTIALTQVQPPQALEDKDKPQQDAPKTGGLFNSIGKQL